MNEPQTTPPPTVTLPPPVSPDDARVAIHTIQTSHDPALHSMGKLLVFLAQRELDKMPGPVPPDQHDFTTDHPQAERYTCRKCGRIVYAAMGFDSREKCPGVRHHTGD